MIRCLNEKHGKNYAFYNGDSVDVVGQMPDNSIDMTVESPPFAALYTYSDSDRDMGNCSDDEEFQRHYALLLDQVHRVLRPGRARLVHCADLPSFIWKHGRGGMRDFSGDLIRAHEKAGFLFDGRITIWKDPVTEMQRTKAHRLLFKTFRTDAGRSAPGNPDYLLKFWKPGKDGAVPVLHDPERFPVETWQEWASPVWMTVDQTRTLNGRIAREDKDEKHMCPLQLDVIERAVQLWSNEGDVVLSPFGGIGSEGVGAITYGRKYVGIELKESYWRTGCENLEAVDNPKQASLFG